MVSKDSLTGPGLITLLTDFGLEDAYAGTMKGVILSRTPGTRLVDLTHQVAPRDVLSGAYMLETAWRHFPAGTVHLVVVDPGVGSQRRGLALSVEGHYFVGPDNGSLSAALPDALRGERALRTTYEERSIALPDGIVAVQLEAPPGASATFEGRDVFAPAAARLAAGEPLGSLGRRLGEMVAFPALHAPPKPGGGRDGLIIHVDRYGNLISDIRAEDLPAEPQFRLERHVLHLARTYAEATGPSAIVGSSGFVEIAVPNSSAALVLGLARGDRVELL
jgi:S-adenosylmethionine hydrolase